jgi:hypothetical protein
MIAVQYTYSSLWYTYVRFCQMLIWLPWSHATETDAPSIWNCLMYEVPTCCSGPKKWFPGNGSSHSSGVRQCGRQAAGFLALAFGNAKIRAGNLWSSESHVGICFCSAFDAMETNFIGSSS